MNLIEMFSARPAPVCGYRVVKGRAQSMSPDTRNDFTTIKHGANDPAVLKALKAGFCNIKGISEHTGIALSSVTTSLHRLAKEGKAVRVSHRVWGAK